MVEMRRPTIGVLLMTVAFVAMAGCLSAVPASATTLCPTRTCAVEEPYASGTAIEAALEKSTKARLLSSVVNIECSSSSLQGKTTAEAGKPLPLEVSTLSYGECKTGSGGSCTVSTVALPSSPSVEATAEDNGTLSLKGGETNFHCGFFINCIYADPALEAKGGKPATLATKETTLTKTEGSLCPEAAKFDVTYTVSKPEAVFVEE